MLERHHWLHQAVISETDPTHRKGIDKPFLPVRFLVATAA